MPLATDQIDGSQPLSDHPFNAGVWWWTPFGPTLHGNRLWNLNPAGAAYGGDLTDGLMMGSRGMNGLELGQYSTTNSGTKTANLTPLEIPATGSLFGWVRKNTGWPGGADLNKTLMMGRRTSASSGLLFDWMQVETSSSQINWGWYNGTRGANAERRYMTSGWTPTIGQWYHMVLTWDSNTTCALYRDGSPLALSLRVGGGTGSSWHATPYLRVGYNEYPGQEYASDATFRDIILTSRVWSASDVAFLYDQSMRDYPDLLRRVPTATWFVGSGANDYSLTASAATYVVTGSAAGVYRGYPLTASAATYVVTGSAATLLRTRIMGADTTSYVVTGTAATLARSRVFAADTASYVVTGTAASLLRGYPLTASAAAYTVTGTAAGLLYGRAVQSSAAAYVVTGTDATLIYSGGQSLPANAAAYTVTGVSAGLLLGRVVQASAGAYVVTGVSAGLLLGRVVQASAGTYVVTGSAATFPRTYVLTSTGATYVVTGTSATLARTRLFSATAASYTGTGASASLLCGRVVPSSAASYTVTGVSASLLYGHRIVASARTYTLAGDEASLIYSGDPSGGFGNHVSKIPLRG